jgi:UDPglucose--hexose-1-phosphate uridylyltransferase
MSDEHPDPVKSEIRINPIVPSESVLVATARSMRPKKAEELAPRDTRKHVETCPFCRGNEHKTPPVILSWPPEGDWQIRMVENLYPVLGDDRAKPLHLRPAAEHRRLRPPRGHLIEHGIANRHGGSHLAALFGVYQAACGSCSNRRAAEIRTGVQELRPVPA